MRFRILLPRFLLIALGLGLLITRIPAAAADAPTTTNSALLTVDRIFGQGEFKLQDWGPARWLADGSGYTTLEPAPGPDGGREIVRYDPASGGREVLVTAAQLTPHGDTKPLSLADYAWSPDARRLLIFTNTKRVWRRETRGDYWLLERATGQLRQLGGPGEPATMMFATFSPDGTRIKARCSSRR